MRGMDKKSRNLYNTHSQEVTGGCTGMYKDEKEYKGI